MSEDLGTPATESGLPWSEFLRSDWLALHKEEALEPGLPIIDPHHHLWPWLNYNLNEFLADVGGGHNIRATVHLETHIGRYPDGPEHLRPVGETELLLQIIDDPRLSEPGAPNICAGIVGDVKIDDPTELIDEALTAHVAAGKGRFKGIRLNAFWYPEISWDPASRFDLMADPRVRAGLALLPKHGLVCDVMAFHTQLEELAGLAAALPEVTFIVNHLGGFLGRIAKREDYTAHLALWRRGVEMLARQPNVLIKLGGQMCDFFSGIQFHLDPLPPSSEKIAEAIRPLVEPAIEIMGPSRCMFESNYPADRQQADYVVLWNSFKRLAAGASADEKAAMFHDNAQRTYRLG